MDLKLNGSRDTFVPYNSAIPLLDTYAQTIK